jgi:hypothetical protein
MRLVEQGRKKMSSLSDKAKAAVKLATQLESEGKLPQALEAFEVSHGLFQGVLRQDLTLSAESRKYLTRYTATLQAKVDGMRAAGICVPVAAAPVVPAMPSKTAARPAATATTKSAPAPIVKKMPVQSTQHVDPTASAPTPPPAALGKSKHLASDDLEASTNRLYPSVPNHKIERPAPPPPSRTSKERDALPPPPPPAEDGLPPSPADPTEDSLSQTGGGLRPRTSVVVLRAMELATELNTKKQIKEATDALQHALAIGRTDGTPKPTLRALEDLIVSQRQKYYEVFKPRPLQDNVPSAAELQFLKQCGVTTSLLLPLWDDLTDGYAAENVFLPCKADNWEDNFVPRLSPKQIAHKAVLQRPKCFSKNPSQLVILKEADPRLIKQTLVADCTFVCSLIVCTAFQQRFPKFDIISRVIFPQDAQGKPMISPKGKYCVKMLLNGATRMVVIDDRLPVAQGTAKLLCTFSSNPDELWVSLMEKAFIKICGGSYDFPGSNSSTDLYRLSGWIPDTVSFNQEGAVVDFDAMWQRFFRNHALGAVIMTMSTPDTQDALVEEKLKLAPRHAYAVLDLQEVEGQRLVKLKNPWSSGSWEGLFSLKDHERWTPSLLSTLNFSQEEADQGVFWMSWADVLHFFRGANLSWNPYMLFAGPSHTPVVPRRLACHGVYQHSPSYAANPQFHISLRNVAKVSTLHVVLERHITGKEFASAAGAAAEDLPMLAMHVFDIGGSRSARAAATSATDCKGGCIARRVVCGHEIPRAQVYEGVYTDRPMCASFRITPATTDFVVIVNQLKGVLGKALNFSITLFTEFTGAEGAGGTAMIHPIPETQLGYVTRVAGSWDAGASCGGKVGSQTFSFNPQYLLTLSAPSHVSIRLHAPACPQSVNVHVVAIDVPPNKKLQFLWSHRVSAVSSSSTSIALHSPVYSHYGCVVDTANPNCMAVDRDHVLVDPPAADAVPEEQHRNDATAAVVTVVLHEGSSNRQVPIGEVPVDSVLPVSAIWTAALGSQLFCSPALSVLSMNGVPVASAVDVRAACRASRSGNASPLSIVLQISLKTEALDRSPELQLILKDLTSVCADMAQDPLFLSRKFSSLMTARWNEGLTKLLLRLDNANCATQSFKDTRKAIVLSCHAVSEALTWASGVALQPNDTATTTTGAQPAPAALATWGAPLHRLPAGMYALIPSMWTKGTPGSFELTVESEAPHTCQPLPREGAQAKQTQTHEGQLRALNTTSPSFTVTNGGTRRCELSQPFFEHPRYSFKPDGSSGGVVSIRLITKESDPSQDTSSVACSLWLFVKVQGGDQYELVEYTMFLQCSPSLREVEVQGQREYIIVVCPMKPSTVKFFLTFSASCAFSSSKISVALPSVTGVQKTKSLT